jgi:xylulokinase
VRSLGEERILAVGGNALSVQSAGPKLVWLRKHEAGVFERTNKVYDAASYLTYRLTGESRLDYGQACWFHPLFNIRELAWDTDVCAELGVPTDIFPPLCWATDLAGTVTRSAAQATGLAEGTPVIAGTGDGPAEQVAVGAVEEGEAALVYGSTMCLLALSNELRVHPKAAAAVGAVPGRHILMTYMNASAALTRWFRDNFGQVEQETEAALGINAYHLLSDQAARVPPGSEGLIVLPYFAGEGHPILDSQARGLILGLTLSHTRAHVYRALLEGVAYGLRHNLETFQEAGLPIKRWIAAGGGTKSQVWTQIVSDVLGQDQELVASPYGAPYGDAYLAGYGVGLFKDLNVLRERWVQPAGKVQHNPQVRPVYDRYYEVYRGLYEPLKEHMHVLARLSTATHDTAASV